MKDVPLGARIRVTGICMLTDANPFNGEVPFNILLRSVDDIVIVARPPWLNVRTMLVLIVSMAADRGASPLACARGTWNAELAAGSAPLPMSSAAEARFWKTSIIQSLWRTFWSG